MHAIPGPLAGPMIHRQARVRRTRTASAGSDIYPRPGPTPSLSVLGRHGSPPAPKDKCTAAVEINSAAAAAAARGLIIPPYTAEIELESCVCTRDHMESG